MNFGLIGVYFDCPPWGLFCTTWFNMYGLVELLGPGEDRLELPLLSADMLGTEDSPYELSESVPDVMRFWVEIVFL